MYWMLFLFCFSFDKNFIVKQFFFKFLFEAQPEQLWPSGNALNSDKYGPGFEAHRRPLVTSGRAPGPTCSSQN